MRLEYPWTDRSGEPIHWTLSVRRDGGFSGPINVGITQSYLDLLDVNAINPQPSASHSDGANVIWTFDPPNGSTLRVQIDAFIQLNAHLGASADVAIFEEGEPVVGVHYRTWVAP